MRTEADIKTLENEKKILELEERVKELERRVIMHTRDISNMSGIIDGVRRLVKALVDLARS